MKQHWYAPLIRFCFFAAIVATLYYLLWDSDFSLRYFWYAFIGTIGFHLISQLVTGEMSSRLKETDNEAQEAMRKWEKARDAE